MESLIPKQPINLEPELPKPKNRHKKRWLFLGGLGFILVLFIGVLIYKTSNILTIAGTNEDVGVYKNFKVDKEPHRIDLLVLGIRGAGDEHGGLLADTILLISFDTKKEKASMISIPRDLYVDLPNYPRKEKINYAYALGEQRRPGGGGLILSKEVVQYVTGVYVDYAVVINFHGFTRLVDALGGVQVTRATDFYEALQWQGEGDPKSAFWYKDSKPLPSAAPPQSQESKTREGMGNQEGPNADQTSLESQPAEPKEVIPSRHEYWVFHVPKGTHTLNGSEALYYVRSRYSSSDFDRMRRQQEVITALKDKVLSLGIIANPVKVFDILDILGDNVRTDMGLGDIRHIVSLARDYSKTPVKTLFLEASEQGLLQSSTSNGQYVLLPRSGTFEEIRKHARSIFDE